MYKIIAAFLLIPSIFFVPDSSLRLLFTNGPKWFFSYISKQAKQIVVKKNMLFNVAVYFPAKLALKLLETKSTQAVLKIVYRKLRKKPCLVATQIKTNHINHLKNIKVNNICELVSQNDIDVVSFDIFDTLLVRPVMNPKDVFYLIAQKLDKKLGIDFISLRWSAEDGLADTYATLEDIYSYIRAKYKLEKNICDFLMAEELHCERQLLQARADMEKIYQRAVRSGKRVIAVSDMYLPSSVLKEILWAKGFDKIDSVYVSCEQKARKDSGKLFNVVLENEKIPAEKMVHIGDNFLSDYELPLRAGIFAIHYPSILDLASNSSDRIWKIVMQSTRDDPFLGMIIAQSLIEIFSSDENAPQNLEEIHHLEQFIKLVIAPFTTCICQKIRSNELIQKEYGNIYFASRDGWLPHLVYNVLGKEADGNRGIYFSSGRRAYFPFLCNSFLGFVKKLSQVDNPETFTLKMLFYAYFSEEGEKLSSLCTEEENRLLVFKDKNHCLAVLQRIEPEVLLILDKLRNNAAGYFHKIFDEAGERVLCFDIGYSGSVSKGLNAILKKSVDKVYCWENVENQKLDVASGTVTFKLLTQVSYSPYNLILEELFSPCVGGVVGFDANGKPIYEDIEISEEFSKDMDLVEKISIDFASKFVSVFSSYACCVKPGNIDCFVEMMRHLFSEAECDNLKIFKNIIFPDPVYFSESLSLTQKIENALYHETVFSKTGFENVNNELPEILFEVNSLPKIGIHLHVYNIVLVQEFLQYLQEFPFQFDILLTTPDANAVSVLKAMISSSLLPLVSKAEVVLVPNRGRDVAPWIIESGHKFSTYDFCCHIHAKESQHIGGYGGDWRRYLLDNLVSKRSAKKIISTMSCDSSIGCIFPPIYHKLKNVMTDVGVPLYGADHEYEMICSMLKRMKLPTNYCRYEQFFSVGTMFWYRPNALAQIFSCGLEYLDFPPEPIGVGGTLAHAFERIPPLVASRNGFKSYSFAEFA
ncbi:MAG: rhamnan synthesis F family protein [Desulfovibrio desulfuricans]|nr:rhamnan synthesis F family protein [Desulfovibrio desulfuricans]